MAVKDIDQVGLDTYKFGFHDDLKPVYTSPKGLNESVVREISRQKDEPAWMLEFRLEALRQFHRKPMPTWGADLSRIDFDDIHYYIRPQDRQARSWDDVPADIKSTFDKLGIPQAERKFLAGVGAQYDSEVVYHSIRGDLEEQGVIFLDMDSGLREHEELVREYFSTVIPNGGQQVRGAEQRGLERRQLRVRARRGARGYSAAGILPYQRREHGAV